MRISDWSSDVCSSDLLVALVYTAGGLMQLVGGWLADRYPLKPIYLSAFVLQMPVMALIASIGSLPLIALSIMTVILGAAALPAENMQIGRASWRVRVCQYV